jgi:hypothetical protein
VRFVLVAMEAPYFFQKKKAACLFFSRKYIVWCALASPVLLPNHTGTDNYYLSGLEVNYRVIIIIYSNE